MLPLNELKGLPTDDDKETCLEGLCYEGVEKVFLERAMGFEPTTTCLGSKDSTTELRPPLAEETSNPTLATTLSQGT